MCAQFYDELRIRFDKEFNRIDLLEGKATNIITTAGTITSLIFGFIAFINSASDFTFPLLLQLLITGSVGTGAASILVSFRALRLRDYSYPIALANFLEKAKDNNTGEILHDKKGIPRIKLDKNGNPELDEKKISDYLAAETNVESKSKLERLFAFDYIVAIYANSKLTSQKARFIKVGLYLLMASIILIGAAAILALASPMVSTNDSGTYLCKLVQEGGREVTCEILK